MNNQIFFQLGAVLISAGAIAGFLWSMFGRESPYRNLPIFLRICASAYCTAPLAAALTGLVALVAYLIFRAAYYGFTGQ